jgi:hypothetical protein
VHPQGADDLPLQGDAQRVAQEGDHVVHRLAASGRNVGLDGLHVFVADAIEALFAGDDKQPRPLRAERHYRRPQCRAVGDRSDAADAVVGIPACHAGVVMAQQGALGPQCLGALRPSFAGLPTGRLVHSLLWKRSPSHGGAPAEGTLASWAAYWHKRVVRG